MKLDLKFLVSAFSLELTHVIEPPQNDDGDKAWNPAGKTIDITHFPPQVVVDNLMAGKWVIDPKFLSAPIVNIKMAEAAVLDEKDIFCTDCPNSIVVGPLGAYDGEIWQRNHRLAKAYTSDEAWRVLDDLSRTHQDLSVESKVI